ncbi:response regulator transcription factor [Neobacillus sp. OS1-32]|jgi:DNA-binding NarL/FixJ family response regulator|uniref:Response regulator transcription factor n=1 Tax=Neobacillus paridis TaxID=2803862 RepID=A0ABS1TY24_9BACI|nr:MULTISPECIES: response regulator transcription factor [Neobacillus]MBL4954810.1 response regulator transcription factor [Neobacillus paridis]WML29007.1 response regulator transcription factor [Neobacillus sp. OS1-32]
MIKIMVVDDQSLMRDGLATILSLRNELEVVGTACDGQDAFEKAKRLIPDIILMDIRMPGTNGVDGTKLIREEMPEIKVLMLTTFKDSELIFEALEEGASGYLLKDMPTDTIVQAILTVHSGGVVLPPDVTAQVIKEMKHSQSMAAPLEGNPPAAPKETEDLTEREHDVLRQLGYGLSNKEIAEVLFITEGTVKNHVSNIISKLGLRDRTQAAIFAVRYGITTYDI